MDAIEIIGYLAAAFTTAANIPQTYIIIREKSTEHISVITYGMLFLGTALWVTYGIIKLDWPIVIANGISALSSLVIILLNFTSQKTINKIHKSVIPESIKKEIKASSKTKK
jgi:MtN3 and saliva related transmembrane protein